MNGPPLRRPTAPPVPSQPVAHGATAEEWFWFDELLRLTPDLLPVVQNPKAVLSPASKIESPGKVPSLYNHTSQLIGFKGWPKYRATSADIESWSKQPDYGICLQTRTVRALDVDVTDAGLVQEIEAMIVERFAGAAPARRSRANSPKFLIPFVMPGTFKKRIITTRAGRIEFLATGQQFVACGTHPSGSRYEWRGGLPITIESHPPAEFEALWAALVERFETGRKTSVPTLPTTASWIETARKHEYAQRDTWFEPLSDEHKVAEVRAIAATWTTEQATDRDEWFKCIRSIADAVERGLDLEAALDIAEAFSQRTTENNLADREAIGAKMLEGGEKPSIYAAAALAQRSAPPNRVPPPPPVAGTGPRTEAITALPNNAIPEAQHPCTDQANAERLHKRYGDRLISCAGTFYTWDGKRWRADDCLAQRFACELSRIVSDEADAVLASAAAMQNAIPGEDVRAHLQHPRLNPLGETVDGARLFELKEIAKALGKWSKECEMKSKQDAVLGLLKKLLAVDVNKLDADLWLLNCENGTVDLRTGQLREHRAADFTTKLAPVHYDPAAQAPRFLSFLDDIFVSNRAVIEFVQRWHGYAATGITREHYIVIHWGAGSNGKSTLIKAVESVLGDYATAAPTGLLTAKDSDGRHPSEIAKLHGKRLVTASESEDGAKLREAFVKNMTGGDMLTGRRMYGEWFDFKPTHKLQLFTNSKPQIRGSDFGIWRRILLVPYTVKFGSADELAAGAVTRLKDTTLGEALEHEMPGILNWLIEGARRWYAEGGLQPPDIVLAASREYREEQDRIGGFIRDCCRFDPQAWQPVPPLYQGYRNWCYEAGIEHPLTRQRFIDELEQRVPGFVRPQKHKVWEVKGIVVVVGLGHGAPPPGGIPPPPMLG